MAAADADSPAAVSTVVWGEGPARPPASVADSSAGEHPAGVGAGDCRQIPLAGLGRPSVVDTLTD